MQSKIIQVNPKRDLRTTNNFYLTDNVPSRSKAVKYLFIVIQALFSQDYGFAKPKTLATKVLMTCFMVTQGSAVAAAYVLGNNLPAPYLFQYYAYIIISFYTSSKYSFCDYQTDLHSFDEQLGGRPLYLQYELITVSLFTIAFKISTAVLCRNLGVIGLQSLYNIILLIPTLSLDWPLIVITFILYSIIRRLRNLRHVVVSGANIIMYQNFYKTLLDLTAKMKNTLDCFLVVSLGTNIPYIMIYAYKLLKRNIEFKMKGPFSNYVVFAIAIIYSFAMHFAPMVAGEFVSAEAENLKVDLHNKLLTETDPNQAQSIERFIRYVEARPFKYSVYKVIPVDLSAIFLFLNICVSYFIVAIQLTHLY